MKAVDGGISQQVVPSTLHHTLDVTQQELTPRVDEREMREGLRNGVRVEELRGYEAVVVVKLYVPSTNGSSSHCSPSIAMRPAGAYDTLRW